MSTILITNDDGTHDPGLLALKRAGQLQPRQGVHPQARPSVLLEGAPRAAADQQARVMPVYETMPGWSASTEGARSWAELPAEAIKYVRRVEELIGCPVALLSTSPERDDTILVTDPFAD